MSNSDDLLLAQSVYLKRLLSKRLVRLLIPRRSRVAALATASATEHAVRARATTLYRPPAVGSEVMVRFATSTFASRGLAAGHVGKVVAHAPSTVAPLEETVVVDWGDGEPQTELLFNLMLPPGSTPNW